MWKIADTETRSHKVRPKVYKKEKKNTYISSSLLAASSRSSSSNSWMIGLADLWSCFLLIRIESRKKYKLETQTEIERREPLKRHAMTFINIHNSWITRNCFEFPVPHPHSSQNVIHEAKHWTYFSHNMKIWMDFWVWIEMERKRNTYPYEFIYNNILLPFLAKKNKSDCCFCVILYPEATFMKSRAIYLRISVSHKRNYLIGFVIRIKWFCLKNS